MSVKDNTDSANGISFRRLAFQSLPEIWTYQIVAGILMLIPVSAINRIIGMVTASPDAVFTTANIKAFLLNWRMPVLVLLETALSLVYMVSEILGPILLNDDILSGRQEGTLKKLKDASAGLRRLINPTGALIILYILVLAPLCGIGYTVSMSSSLRIPNFIMDVITATPLLLILYFLALILLIWLGYRFIFVFHAVILDGMDTKGAIKHSSQLVKNNRKSLLKGILVTCLILVAIRILTLFLLMVIPQSILAVMSAEGRGIFAASAGSGARDAIVFRRSVCIFVITAGRYLYSVISLMCSSYFMLRLNCFYRTLTSGEQQSFPSRPKRSRYYRKIIFLVFIMLLIMLLSVALGNVFDEIIGLTGKAQIVAHRAGGDMASENSLEGLEAAIEHNCYGSEIDVQRTADGYYIINHDGDFGRLTGVAQKPEEMTLEEILQLRIKDTTGSGALLTVPTIEEMLEAVKGREKLFIELKGTTADHRMVDDLVAIIREYGCVDDVILISLSYDVINYAETNYPEFETGVLFFAGIGDVSELNCDILLMEEKAATLYRIERIHSADKKAAVWTVNTETGMKHFLIGSVDLIITDKVEMGQQMIGQLAGRDEYMVILDYMDDILKIIL